ncbi:MAG: phytanoyl-CoA dioxygenase family protein [Rhodospirillaceae bacterium]|nr:phytanoyl-CoA dioxygenase family protein [Rhodospirillaceae bacterium]
MSASLVRLPATAQIDDYVAALEANGAAIVEGFLAPEQLAALNADFDRIVEMLAPGVRNPTMPAMEEFYGGSTVRFDGLPGKSAAFVEVMQSPVLTGLADHYLLPHCLDYLFNTGQFIEIRPGETAQRLHRDEDAWRFGPLVAEGPRAQLEVEAMVALSDFTAVNGATQVVPGSHLWPADREPEPAEIQQAEMPAGSALIYLGSTIHGGGANRTAAEARRGMFAGYVVGWLRTEENMFLTVPLEQVRGLPRRVQELLGYKAHRAIGVVDVGDPGAVLAR